MEIFYFFKDISPRKAVLTYNITASFGSDMILHQVYPCDKGRGSVILLSAVRLNQYSCKHYHASSLSNLPRLEHDLYLMDWTYMSCVFVF